MASSAMPKPALHVQTPSFSGLTQTRDLDAGGPDTNMKGPDPDHLAPESTPLSPTSRESREVANRLHDDLELLRAERVVSQQDHQAALNRSKSRRSHVDERVPEDAFNTATTQPVPVAVAPPKTTWLTRLWALVRRFPRVLRYVVYAIPPGVIILVPVFLDLFAYDRKGSPVGGPHGVQLLWFGIWLEVVWLTLWAARIVTSIMPALVGFAADTAGSSNHKKWKDIGRQLELPTALFLWQLAVLVSYRPILDSHRVLTNPSSDDPTPYILWIDVVYKVIIALFVLATLNLVEKILIKWIATSFHLRTYSHRIRENQMQIDCLVALYTYAKTSLEALDASVWESSGGDGRASFGSPSPMAAAIRTNARHVWSKVGSAATRMAGDFTGKKVLRNNHPRRVVTELLRTTESSYTLARLFYRTFLKPGNSTITVDDIQPAFPSPEDAEACFGVFDKDLNGDVSMEELEMVCNEIHLEKKAIAASLKDLDSVIKKLDQVFMFIIVVIVIIVFISIISNSAAAALTSAGTFILGLSWLLQATAQEFLQSIIFVFVKHPFDVGDRVTVYGNTGSMMRGDDYYVLEVSLLYTEFKKMEGHVVQAPNSLLNTLFILNQRRSQGLADPINLKLRFGTTEAQIEELKARMLEFCLQNKRDYAPRIISEVQTIDEVSSITMNIIFFHKSNYQNELLRLTRHNKFAVELMRQMHDMGLETPRLVQPGGMQHMPLYWTQVPPPPAYHQGTMPSEPPLQAPSSPAMAMRKRGNSRAAVVEAGMDFQDVYHNRRPETSHGMARLPSIRQALREEDEMIHSPMDELSEKRHSMESESTRRKLWRPRSRSTNHGSASHAV